MNYSIIASAFGEHVEGGGQESGQGENLDKDEKVASPEFSL